MLSRPVKLILISIVPMIAGCASWGVEPWQREELSRAEMMFSDPSLGQVFSRHFYFSKEASRGGGSFAGGGCGCN
jgi:hypothetical protein